jgi:cell division protein DivIC
VKPETTISMKVLSHLPAWLRNKYFLCTAGFIAWMLFFDPRDVYTQIERTKELNDLRASKRYYQEQITVESTELQQLKNNPATLEKYAREKYLMKRENEDLFVISENPDPVHN